MRNNDTFPPQNYYCLHGGSIGVPVYSYAGFPIMQAIPN